MAARRMPKNRKIPQEIVDLFDNYIDNNVRHLAKQDAINMLMKEFSLTEIQAVNMFDTFDKDCNGVMSVWEFQQFYETVGRSAQDMIKVFEEMDKDGSGMLDKDEAKEGLKTIKDADGRNLEDKEIDFFIKTCLNDDGVIDLGHFGNLLHRLKLYHGPPKK